MNTSSDPAATDMLAEALRWLADVPHDNRGGRTLPALRHRFGLTTKQAIDVIREHNESLARTSKQDAR